MELREGDNFLEILLRETSPADSPTPGDVRLDVRVCSEGFAGSASVWADAESFRRFLVQLREVEATRRGVARLEAIASPDEFWLEFRVLDRAGHLAVFGRLTRLEPLGAVPLEIHHQAVEFGFEFCPSRLPGVLAGFQRMRSISA